MAANFINLTGLNFDPRRVQLGPYLPPMSNPIDTVRDLVGKNQLQMPCLLLI